MNKRVTIYDVANKLGISTATVNRALTGKTRVREETRALVIQTATEMGFRPNALARSLARKKIRLAVVAFTSFPEFHDSFLSGTREAASELVDYNVQTDYFSYDTGATNTKDSQRFLEETLDTIADNGYDGALILARQIDKFKKLIEKGVCVATAVNDIAPNLRRFCISHNGFVAGKIAAELTYRWMSDRAQPVAIASGWPGNGIHQQTILGFKAQMEKTPLVLCEIYHHFDNEELAYSETKRVLDNHPDLGAIYVNSFNSRNVIRAVKEHGLAGKITLVTSDIYDSLRTEIEQGFVVASIFQNQYEQGKRGLHALYQALTDESYEIQNITIEPRIILNSNLSLF